MTNACKYTPHTITSLSAYSDSVQRQLRRMIVVRRNEEYFSCVLQAEEVRSPVVVLQTALLALFCGPSLSGSALSLWSLLPPTKLD